MPRSSAVCPDRSVQQFPPTPTIPSRRRTILPVSKDRWMSIGAVDTLGTFLARRISIAASAYAPSSNSARTSKLRFYELDLLRFGAALSVVFFHYGFQRLCGRPHDRHAVPVSRLDGQVRLFQGSISSSHQRFRYPHDCIRGIGEALHRVESRSPLPRILGVLHVDLSRDPHRGRESLFRIADSVRGQHDDAQRLHRRSIDRRRLLVPLRRNRGSTFSSSSSSSWDRWAESDCFWESGSFSC